MRMLSGLMFLISLCFGGLFWVNYTGLFDVAQDPIGQIRISQGLVRRLGAEALTWDRSTLGTLVGRGDTIAVGEQGFVQMVIFEGAMVELEAGSMVTLTPGLDTLELNFLSGGGTVKITAEAKKKIRIKTDPVQKGQVASVRVQEVAQKEIIPTKPAARIELETMVRGAIKEQKLALPNQRALVVPIQAESIRNPAGMMDTGGTVVSVRGVPEPPKIMFTDFLEQTGGVIDVGEMKRKGAVPELTWVAAAKDEVAWGYEVRFSPVDGKTRPRSFSTTKPSLALTKVKPGRYLWSVRQISRRGRRGNPTPPQYLEILASQRRKIVFELPDKPVGTGE